MENSQQNPMMSEPHEPVSIRTDYTRQTSATVYKSPGLAGCLSLLPGLGQVYCGYYKHGFITMAVFAGLVTLLNNIGNSGLEPLLGIFVPFFYLYNIIDAVQRAKMYNRLIEGHPQMKAPPDFEMPGLKGSLTGGIALVILGGLIFLHTMFNISLAWLEDWWPLAIVGFGIFLIYKDLKERKGIDLTEKLFQPREKA